MIELLGKENVKINTDQMSEIMTILKKEKEMFEEEKREKSKEKPSVAMTTDTAVKAGVATAFAAKAVDAKEQPKL